MNQQFQGWAAVSAALRELARGKEVELNKGQRASLVAIAERFRNNGVIVADEVGMGKTRIAVAVVRCVRQCGGRVAIVIPPGLGYQWAEELRKGEVEAPPILRSLWQYLQAWEEGEGKAVRPWFNEGVVVISHSFSNWRLGERTAAWRCMLLPELYAQWRKREGRLPRRYLIDERLRDPWVKSAARSISDAASGGALETLDSICCTTPWPRALETREYGRDDGLRKLLEKAVGLGLGVFDLVVIDEAHKSRGTESGLNRMVEDVLVESDGVRRLALTATPVELDAAQWQQMLVRVGADGASAMEAIQGYRSAVRRVRECPHDAEARAAYRGSAKEFQQRLSPYLVRRDKREERAVADFSKCTGEAWHGYRREVAMGVDPRTLTEGWKQAVCAAESLSVVTRQAEDGVSKRLRLTMGNGHGLAKLLDGSIRDEAVDGKEGDVAETEAGMGPGEEKRRARAEWWRRVMAAPFADGDGALYDHPVIGKAVEEIERVVGEEEKVLVFGRFTRPLKALVDLLNAREMLRSLDGGRPWPQAKIGEKEWGAVRAAHRQLGRDGELDEKKLCRDVEAQYARLEGTRRANREALVRWLRQGDWPGGSGKAVARLYESLRERGRAETMGRVARAMLEMLSPEEVSSRERRGQAFAELVGALGDADRFDEPALDDEAASEMWATMEARLEEEYSRTEGSYARLLNGATPQPTRRLLQQGFQRRHGYPRVLVAQSQVGREGLNLHQSCRTVVMVHPEWNPGAVEQQIGRVDRLGSFWEQKLGEAMERGVGAEELPRIEFRAVVFQGTYDEWNWQVLRERWVQLRAQLHGVVIDGVTAARCGGLGEAVVEINDAAPNFSPVRGEG